MPNPKLETYKNKATGDVYDYTDADAQGKLTAILDGTTIDSFADVESALGDKVDAVAGKGLSTNDYDDTEKAKVAAAFPRSEQAVLGAVNRLNFPAWSKVGISDATATWDNDTYTLTLTSTSLSGRTNLTVPVDAQIDVQPGQTITFLWDSTGSDDTVMTFDVFKVGETSTTIASASIHENKLTMVVPANCYKLTYRVMSNSANKVIKIANCMCVFGDGTGAVFVPYAMTNRKLTELIYKEQGSALIATYTFAENISSDAAAVARAGYIIMHTLRLIASANIEANTVVITDGLGYVIPNVDMAFNTVFRTSAGDEYKMSIVTGSGGKVQLKTLTAIPNGTQLRGSIIFISQ